MMLKQRVHVALDDSEVRSLEDLRRVLPNVTDHRLLLGAVRFGLDELKRNPSRIRAYVENRSGRPVTK